MFADEELSATARIYRDVARRLSKSSDEIGVRFVVDVLSGTSAGGLNAIFLAKALVREAEITPLRDIWLNEGDFSHLINDAESLSGLPPPPLEPESPPNSLLNSSRMLRLLRRGFEQVEESAQATTGRSRYVGELDLFVTTTDVFGLDVGLPLADGTVHEKRHRKVFEFRYPRPTSDDPDVFGAEGTDFLAYASRCTAAFPAAFRPMQFADLRLELGPAWIKNFFTDYPHKHLDRRPFSDGGILDNKPFSHATRRLLRRSSAVPTKRNLVFIEPDPGQAAPSVEERVPDALGMAQRALLGIPRYETIREDIEEVLARNQLIERARRALLDLETVAEVVPQAVPDFETDEWVELGFNGALAKFGPSYGPYQRLRVEAVLDWLTALLLAAGGLEDRTDLAAAISQLFSRRFRAEEEGTLMEASDAPRHDERELLGGLRRALSAAPHPVPPSPPERH